MAGAAYEDMGRDLGPPDLRAVGDRIDALLDASSAGGAVARERAEELVRLVADLYGAGIERMLDILYDAGRLDDEVLADLAADDLVAGLLIVHGLHPYDVEERVARALEKVRPYLGSHGGDVELLEVTPEGVVRLRLLGTCDGCPSSSVTLALAVEGAIEAAAPDINSIQVEAPTSGIRSLSSSGSPSGSLSGPPSWSPSERAASTDGPLIPADSLMSHVRGTRVDGAVDGIAGTGAGAEAGAGAGGSWEGVPELDDLQPGQVARLDLQQLPLVGCRVGEDLYAFRSPCARCGADLAGATLGRCLGGDRHDALLVCPSCEAHFDVRRAGACVEESTLHLDPLPVLRDDGVVCVAVPRPVAS